MAAMTRIVSPEDFFSEGLKIMKRQKDSKSLNTTWSRRFSSHFGVCPVIVSIIWASLESRLPASTFIHLLWALLFLKVYATESVLSGMVGADEKTYRLHVWRVIQGISNMRQEFITLENRFMKQNGSRCLLSVDGTDFRINEPTPFSSEWCSHKFKCAALRYEVSLVIQTGEIASINGPFAAGKYQDLTIFRSWLKKHLLPGERVEADAVYRDERCHCPFDFCFNEEQYRAKFTVRARHETVNKRFKQFGILNQRFRHPKEKHGEVLMSIAVITQISIRNGYPLFPVQYRTYNGT